MVRVELVMALLASDASGVSSNPKPRGSALSTSASLAAPPAAAAVVGGRDAEDCVEVRAAGNRGMGVFALEKLPEGSWIASYEGTVTTAAESEARYGHSTTQADYIFRVDDDVSIDAQNSTHFSRYFNHNFEQANLYAETNAEEVRVDFFALRDIEKGEELTFDYGVAFWLFRQPPDPETDSRNFSDPRYRERPPELSLLHPPSVGTILPLTPLTAVELQAVLALPEAESRAALLRCLDFFGAKRLVGYAQEALEVPFGVGVAVRREVILIDDVSYSVLQEAAVGCIVTAVLDSADPTGATSRQFEGWVSQSAAELAAVRRWRARVPPFASARHDAVALAAYLLWKNPSAHGVQAPLSRDVVDRACAQLQEQESVEQVVEMLEQHAPLKEIRELVATFERWIVVGAGCTVQSVDPPTLSGEVPNDLGAVWSRIPALLDYGLLSYDAGVGTYHPPFHRF